ncbi:DUF3604 domain-containing protein [Vallitalea okinawensis]|uniref:DUF3604 domain-containing protein n=1 Tax=Vallitalea okinawensis TaxID=2078660 RepID=UPI000CFD8DAD|nr:DUF3604 domain-containing protein [Vallitalea okinawensis]
MNRYTYKNDSGFFDVEVQTELIVDSELEWKITYTAIKGGINQGGSLKILVPPYQHQRTEEYLQAYDYWKPNYLYAIGEDDGIQVETRIEKVSSAFNHIKRWPDSNRIAIITLLNGLNEGEKIHIVFGGIHRPWLEGDCPPTRVGQLAFKKEGTYLHNRVWIDQLGNGNYEEVQAFPKIKLIPDQPKSILLKAPSVIQPGKAFEIDINVVDRFNNPIFEDDNIGQWQLEIEELEGEKKGLVEYKDKVYKAVIKEEGFYEITVKNHQDLRVDKAVMMCKKSDEKLFWGDIHIHSNLTANIRDNDGGASPKVGYQYAKEVSHLDFICMSEQTFEFNEDRSVNINKATWSKIGEEADKYYEKDKLVTFPGFEFHSQRGDTVVLFKESLAEYPYPAADVKDIPDVWNYYRDKEHLTIPHFHRYCGGRISKDQQEKKYAGFDISHWELSSENERLAEVFSSQWGRFEYGGHPMILKAKSNVKGNTLVDFLNRGKRWGITASSDGHDGNPGYGGVTAVYAKGLNREEIYRGLCSRKTIASTHPRIVIDYSINEYSIGEVVSGERRKTKIINIKAVAPKDIKQIEIIKNGEVHIKEAIDKQWAKLELRDSEVIEEDTYYYVRLTQIDGHIAWTSPIWFV